MDVLIIGGTGAISHAVATEALRSGDRVTLVNRGTSATHPLPPDADVVVADARDPGALRAALPARSFDCVVDFVAFTAAHAADDIETFTGRAGQFIFISSASAYQKPIVRLPITESTPLRTRSGSTPGTRSRPRRCSFAPTARTPSRSPSSGRPAPTTRPGSRSAAGRWSSGCAPGSR